MAVISIKDIYNEEFGIKPKYLVPRRGSFDLVESPDYTGFELWDEETAANVTKLGTPILDQITLEDGRYQTFEVQNGVMKPLTVIFPGYTFPGWPMLDVSQDKVIVTTAINGRQGTIKEYIYTDDYQVTIRGILVGDGNNYPYYGRKKLADVCKINASYGVVSRVLMGMGIYALVFKSVQFNDVEGYNNVCTYTITALSDLDIVLDINKKLA